MDEIIAYLQKKYDPAAVLVYGSFADGTQSENSDFDALVLSQTHREFHDTSFVGETQLDVFVYPVSLFQGEYHPETFVQVYGGIPVYLGPKKSLRFLEKQNPTAYGCYTRALTDFRYDTLKAWIDCMENTRTQSDSL